MRYFIVIEGRRKGPFALEVLEAQGLERDSLVWCQGLADWSPASQVPALQELVAALPPPLPAHVTVPFEKDERDSHERTYAPSTLDRLVRWWAYLLAASLAMPLFGALCLLLAETQRFPRRSGSYTYYRYSEIGEALQILGGLSIGLTALPLIGAVVLFAILLFKMWSVIQDGHARTTPDKAVGFLFIPFFNAYWAFIAVHGLAVDLNKYIRRHRTGMDIEPSPTQLSLIFCILFACTAVPYFGLLTLIPTAVAWFILVPRLKNCVTAILRIRQAAETDMEVVPEKTGQPIALDGPLATRFKAIGVEGPAPSA